MGWTNTHTHTHTHTHAQDRNRDMGVGLFQGCVCALGRTLAGILAMSSRHVVSFSQTRDRSAGGVTLLIRYMQCLEPLGIPEKLPKSHRRENKSCAIF